jgi:translation initiation factor 2 subunit 1
MEGLILSTEITNKRVKLINKFLKVGKIETMTVIRVDKDKRYIDLSKKKVQLAEATSAEKYFKKAKMVHNILKQVATKLNCTLLELYEQFGWDLYDKYGHSFDAFRMIMKYLILNITIHIVILTKCSVSWKSQKTKRST